MVSLALLAATCDLDGRAFVAGVGFGAASDWALAAIKWNIANVIAITRRTDALAILFLKGVPPGSKQV